MFSRIFRRIWFAARIPFESIWFNPNLKSISAKSIIVYDTQITVPFLCWLRENNPGSKIVFLYNNIIRTTLIAPDAIPTYVCDKVVTFDSGDAEKYNIDYEVGGYMAEPYNNGKNSRIDFDILFVGRDKGRLTALLELQKRFNDMGVTTYFHIVGDRSYFNKKGYPYRKLISHKEVLYLLSRAKVMLVLLQEGQTGIDIRVYDALFNKKKIITNNTSIKNFDFYRKENIFILGENVWDEMPAFLRSPYFNIEESILERYAMENYLARILSA